MARNPGRSALRRWANTLDSEVPRHCDTRADVGHAEAHVARLGGHGQLVEELAEVGVGALVVHQEPGVGRHRPLGYVDRHGVGVASRAALGLEEVDLVGLAEDVRCGHSGDAASDDGDAHGALWFHLVLNNLAAPMESAAACSDSAATRSAPGRHRTRGHRRGQLHPLGLRRPPELWHWGATTHQRGRVLVVTGASSGIGRAVAVGLARAGASLWLIGRDPRPGPQRRRTRPRPRPDRPTGPRSNPWCST